MTGEPLDLSAMQQRLAGSEEMRALADRVKAEAMSRGFMLCGIAPAQPSRYADYFRQWLEHGQAGEMHYMASRLGERLDVRQYLPGAQSVICLAMNYHVPLEGRESVDTAAQSTSHTNLRRPERIEGIDPVQASDDEPEAPLVPARIARYAQGEDYHQLIKGKLFQLADWLKAQVRGCQTRACVDTAPVMEKEHAARAGIGWMGKNTCIIHPRLGSWFFLGVIATTLELPADVPAIDRCGSCTRCLDACPTGALTAAYQMDARRCISYLTIEHRGEINPALQKQVGDWLFGCDICQDVCPFNSRELPISTEPAMQPRFAGGGIDAMQVMGWSEDEYRKTLKGSAMRRVKLPVLQRNASIVIENTTNRR